MSNGITSITTSEVLTVPAVTEAEVSVPVVSTVIFPPIEPLDKAPTVVIATAPATGAYNVLHQLLTTRELIKVLTSEDTLASKLSLDESTVKPDNLLISAPAVTDVLFNTSPVASTDPLTSNLPLDNVNKSASRFVPIVEPVILTLPISPVVDVTFTTCCNISGCINSHDTSD